jgi:cell division protease FtsH
MNGSEPPRPPRSRSSGGRWPLVWVLLFLILGVVTVVSGLDRQSRYTASSQEVYRDIKRGFIDTSDPVKKPIRKKDDKLYGHYKDWAAIKRLIDQNEPTIIYAMQMYNAAEQAQLEATRQLNAAQDELRRASKEVGRTKQDLAAVEGQLSAQPAPPDDERQRLEQERTRLQTKLDEETQAEQAAGARVDKSQRDLDEKRKTAEHLEQQYTQAKGDWGAPLTPDERDVLENKKAGHPFVARIDPEAKDLVSGISERLPVVYSPSNDMLTQILIGFLPVLFIIAVIYFLISRQMRSASGGAMSFAKSRAKALVKDTHRVTFKDVAGVEEAKEELVEIIEFLKDPRRFTKLGGRIPKGVLLVGPPGTGKTLLAKSVAGEADVPFFTISGSDFVEMFVGVGAARVRDMFEQGKRNAPCIIFMDEIDAVGRHRGAGIGGGHDEREQTLNQLLVEMDGFDTKEGVILMAATNRPDVLDPALLRSGRFDRQVVIDMPDLNGREGILKVHVRKVKLGDDVDLRRIARGTPGFSGADLANLINEAALLAARENKLAVDMTDLEEARDKVAFGRERRSRTLSPEERKITAYHEAGHAVVLDRIEECEPLHKVTIVPRGVSFLGATMQLPERDKYLQGRRELLGQIAGLLAGRIAEELFFEDVTTGAASDFKNATRVAHAMVCDLGMSDTMGRLTYGSREDSIFLGKELGELGRHREFSEQTAREIDAEVRRIVDECAERARAILTEYKDRVQAVAEALLEYEVLEGKEVTEIIEGRWTPEAHAARKPAPRETEARETDTATPPADEKLPRNVVPRPNQSSA